MFKRCYLMMENYKDHPHFQSNYDETNDTHHRQFGQFGSLELMVHHSDEQDEKDQQLKFPMPTNLKTIQIQKMNKLIFKKIKRRSSHAYDKLKAKIKRLQTMHLPQLKELEFIPELDIDSSNQNLNFSCQLNQE